MAVNRDFAKNYFMGGGELFVKLPGSNVFKYFAQTDDFKASFKVDKVEHKNSESSVVTLDLEVVKEVNAEVKFTTSDLNKEILAIAFGGTYSETNQDSGSVTDEEIDGVEAGGVYEVGYTKISNVVVKYKDGDDDVEAVEDKDYSVNYKFGLIEIAKDGALVGKDIKVSFDYAKNVITEFSSLDDVSKEVTLQFVSDPLQGKAKKTTIHRVKLSIDGDFDLKSPTDVLKLSFSGKVLKDNTKPEGKQFIETIEVV